MSGNKTQTSTSSNNSTTTPTNLAGLQAIFNQVQGAASTPYSPYGGQMVAPINAQQQLGIDNVNSAAGSAQPFYDTAAGYGAQAGAAIAPSQISRYLNPYTQSVINATQANFNESNGQQQQQVKGNAALAGALGGDRQAVAQAETARQQKLAQDPVIANLNQQNYTQALSAAQADRSASGNAAGIFGNLGTASQTAALQGAGAQINAGTLQQQTQQAQDTAGYQQYLQAQGFPYQQAQFFAQYGLPAASAQGSSTSGTGSQSTPGPNPWVQAAGLGLSAASLFSDERVKEGKKVIGETFDGQPIYSFRYKGSPATQIGLMAQDVEQSHPYAVGEHGGIKTVNYEDATNAAARKGHFASGGAVETPFSFIDGPSYIPKGQPIQMATTPQAQASAPSFASSQPQDQTAGLIKQMGGMKGIFGSGSSATPDYGQTNNVNVGGYSMPQFGNSVDVGGYSMPTIGFNSGGLVEAIHAIHGGIKKARGGMVGNNPFQAFAGGGAVAYPGTDDNMFFASGSDEKLIRAKRSLRERAIQDDEERRRYPRLGGVNKGIDTRAAQDIADRVRGYADGGATFDDRFGAAFPSSRAVEAPVEDTPFRLTPPEAMDAWRAGADRPNPAVMADTPALAGPAQSAPAPAANPMLQPALPPQITNPDNAPDEIPESAMAFDARGIASRPQPEEAQASGTTMGGFNPFNLSDKTRQALMVAGLGVAASKSPFALSAIGEGGMKGAGAYADATAAEREAADKKVTQRQNQTRIDQEAKRITQGAEQFAKTNSLAERRQRLAEDKTPEGYRSTKDGNLEPIPNGPADPDKIRRDSEAKRVPGQALDDETSELLADRVLAGDKTALVGLGRGAQGSENIARVQKFVARKAKEQGLDAKQMLRNVAEQAMNVSGARALGTKEVHFGVAEKAMEESLPIALAASKEVPRTQWKGLTKLIQEGQTQINDPKLKRFLIATDTAAKDYARTINPQGVLRESDIAYARKILSTADSEDAYEAALKQLKIEAGVTQRAIARQKEEIKTGKHAPQEDHSPAPAAAGSIPVQPKTVPAGSSYSPSRKQWRAPDGAIFNADGSKV